MEITETERIEYHVYADAERNRKQHQNPVDSAIEKYDCGNLHWECVFDDNDNELYFAGDKCTRISLFDWEGDKLATVCSASGKTEYWQYGYDADGRRSSIVRRNHPTEIGDIVEYRLDTHAGERWRYERIVADVASLVQDTVKAHDRYDFAILCSATVGSLLLYSKYIGTELHPGFMMGAAADNSERTVAGI